MSKPLHGRDFSEVKVSHENGCIVWRDWRSGVRRVRAYCRGQLLTPEQRKQRGIKR